MIRWIQDWICEHFHEKEYSWPVSGYQECRVCFRMRKVAW